ncbi:uncharacterized protein RCH25_009218 [Pelodytes ibericus]
MGVVFKPADKGGSLVIMNRSDYVSEMKGQLSDVNTYQKLNGDPVSEIKEQIDTILAKAFEDKIIDKSLLEFLTCHHPVTPVLYTLPKIHKSLSSPPGRPIVAGINSLLNPLSVFLDKVFRGGLSKIKSFLMDTTDLLNKLQDANLEDQTILVSLDITSLYTSIPHMEGIRAMQEMAIKLGYTGEVLEFVMKLLNLVLCKNYFRFADEYYLQIQGTAMGSNVAPTYANIFMSDFEEQPSIDTTNWMSPATPQRDRLLEPYLLFAQKINEWSTIQAVRPKMKHKCYYRHLSPTLPQIDPETPGLPPPDIFDVDLLKS